MVTFDKPRPAGYPAWFDLMVPDVHQVTSFYQQLFGWTYTDSGPDYGNYHMAAKDCHNVAGLGNMPENTAFPSSWTVYYSADDIQAMSQKAKALGASIISEPFEVAGQGYIAIIQDPTGAIFGLWQALNHIGASLAETHGAMVWCEVNTRDANTAREFYTALFDAASTSLAGSGVDYYVLDKDGSNIGGILQMNEHWQGIPPHWMAYFQVDDVEQVAQIAQAAGGKVMVSPFATAFGRISVLTDPAGAAFAVVQR